MSLLKTLEQVEIKLSNNQIDAFVCYENEIREWSSRVRLVSPKDLTRLEDRHFSDSILPLFLQVFKRGMNVIDIGSGAGFPGIPISICRPDLKITLLESNRKKGLFLKHMVRSLKSEGLSVEIERAEVLGENIKMRDRFDLALSRAVSSISQIIIWSFPLIKPGGQLILFKGPDPGTELKQAERELNLYGGKLEAVEQYNLSTLPLTSSLIVIKKNV